MKNVYDPIECSIIIRNLYFFMRYICVCQRWLVLLIFDTSLYNLNPIWPERSAHNRVSVTGSVIQAIRTVEFEEGLKMVVLP